MTQRNHNKPVAASLYAAGNTYVTANSVAAHFGNALPNAFTWLVRYKSKETGQRTLMSFGNSVDSIPYILLDIGFSAGQARFTVRGDGGGTDTASTVGKSYNDGEWHTFVAKKTPTGIYLYENGVLVGSDTSLSIGATTINQFAVGALLRTTPSNYALGNIADPIVWDRELTDNEILEASKFAIYPTNGLIFRADFQDVPQTYGNLANATVSDLSGKGYDGTLTIGTGFRSAQVVPSTPRQNIRNINASVRPSVAPRSATGSVDLTSPNTGGTVVGFFKVFSYAGNYWWVVRDAAGLDTIRLNIESGTGYPFIWHTNAAGSGTVLPKVSSAGIVPLHTWVRLGCTVYNDGTNVTCEIFLNGKVIGSATAVRTSRLGSYLELGNSTDFQTAGIKAYNRRLTREEMLRDFIGENIEGARIDWRTDEGAGNTLYDSSGNGFNSTGGTLTWSSDTPMKARKRISGNLVANGDLAIFPPTNVLTNTTGRFIDGTAAGSTTNDIYRWWTGGGGSWEAGFDHSVTFNGKPTLCVRTLAPASYVELFNDTNPRITPTYYGDFVPVTPNTTYKYSFWLKTEYISGDSSGVGVGVYEANGSLVGITSSTLGGYVKTTQDFTYYSGTITTNANARYMNFGLRVYGHTGAGDLIMSGWLAEYDIEPITVPRRLQVNENIVKNGDFETMPLTNVPTTTASRYIDGTAGGSTTNKTFKWCAPNSAFGGAGTGAFFTTVDGINCMCLTVPTTGGTAKVASVRDTIAPSVDELYQLLPNTSYTLTFKVKTINAVTNSVFLDFFELNTSLASIATNTSAKFSGTNEMTDVTMTFTTNAATAYGYVMLRVNISGAVQTAYFGKIKIQPTTPIIRLTT